MSASWCLLLAIIGGLRSLLIWYKVVSAPQIRLVGINLCSDALGPSFPTRLFCK